MTTPETKECPYCAETIKANAVICRYCQQKLSTNEQNSSFADIDEQKQSTDESNVPLSSFKSMFQKILENETHKDTQVFRKSGILSGIIFLLVGICIIFSSFESVHIVKLALGLLISAIGIFMYLYFGSKK